MEWQMTLAKGHKYYGVSASFSIYISTYMYFVDHNDVYLLFTMIILWSLSASQQKSISTFKPKYVSVWFSCLIFWCMCWQILGIELLLGKLG